MKYKVMIQTGDLNITGLVFIYINNISKLAN